MRVAITQPTCLPWLGYFQLIAKSDIFVFLDNVQFERRSWQSRNKIRSLDGRVHWLSIPVVSAARDTLIKDVELASNAGYEFRKQYETVRRALNKAPYFREVETLLVEHFDVNLMPAKLAHLNIRFIKNAALAMGICSTRFVCASDLSVSGKREALILEICKDLGADVYCSSAGSACYLEAARNIFQDCGIELVYQDWLHPKYEQLCAPFESHLSCIDAIASVGLKQCYRFLTQ